MCGSIKGVSFLDSSVTVIASTHTTARLSRSLVISLLVLVAKDRVEILVQNSLV
jgi:hypothetical protein